jgi:hypothetical protein
VVRRRRHIEFSGVDRDVPRAGSYVVHEEFGIELIGRGVGGREEGEVSVAEAVGAKELLGEAGLLLVEVRLVIVIGGGVVARVEAFVAELLVAVVVAACVGVA